MGRVINLLVRLGLIAALTTDVAVAENKDLKGHVDIGVGLETISFGNTLFNGRFGNTEGNEFSCGVNAEYYLTDNVFIGTGAKKYEHDLYHDFRNSGFEYNFDYITKLYDVSLGVCFGESNFRPHFKVGLVYSEGKGERDFGEEESALSSIDWGYRAGAGFKWYPFEEFGWFIGADFGYGDLSFQDKEKGHDIFQIGTGLSFDFFGDVNE